MIGEHGKTVLGEGKEIAIYYLAKRFERCNSGKSRRRYSTRVSPCNNNNNKITHNYHNYCHASLVIDAIVLCYSLRGDIFSLESSPT